MVDDGGGRSDAGGRARVELSAVWFGLGIRERRQQHHSKLGLSVSRDLLGHATLAAPRIPRQSMLLWVDALPVPVPSRRPHIRVCVPASSLLHRPGPARRLAARFPILRRLMTYDRHAHGRPLSECLE